MNLNKTQLIGRLVEKPELRNTNSGKNVTNIRIAVDREYKNDAGERETDFFDVTLWASDAEFASAYGDKGRLVYVEARLQNGSYEKDGQKIRTTEIIGSDFKFLDKAPTTAA